MTKTTREIYMEKALHARAGARDGFHVAVHCEDLIALLEDAVEYERLGRRMREKKTDLEPGT